METALYALGLALILELVTIYLRLVTHKRSAPLQKKLHLPRIHHSYPGLAILLLDYVYLQNEWLFVLGFALVLSDLAHHLIVEPYLKKHGYDVGMKHHRRAHHYVSRVPSAVALIGVGLFALATPFTPGSWLALIGLGMLVGKNPRHSMRAIRKRLSR